VKSLTWANLAGVNPGVATGRSPNHESEVFATQASPTFRRRQAKLARSSRWKTGSGKAIAGRPVVTVA
jgi:hypothetical protein